MEAVSKKKVPVIIIAMLLAGTLTFDIHSTRASGTTVFYDDFNGTQLSTGWDVENLNGSYSLNNSI